MELANRGRDLGGTMLLAVGIYRLIIEAIADLASMITGPQRPVLAR